MLSAFCTFYRYVFRKNFVEFSLDLSFLCDKMISVNVRVDMEMDKKQKISSIKLLLACYFLYTVSVSIKMVYSAEMAEIINSVGTDKSSVSLGLLFYYSAYAVAQFIFSFVISKLDLTRFIIITVCLTALSFGMMFFASEIWHLYIILFLNGFFQVGIWGGVIFFVGRYIPGNMSGFATKLLATGLPLGTTLTYGISALFIAVLDWRYTFLFFSLLSIITVFVFWFALNSAAKNLSSVFAEKLKELSYNKKTEQNIAYHKGGILPMVIFFTFASVLLSCIYYALTSWFPSMLIENFSMPTEYSILITLFLPFCTTPSSFAIIGLKEKMKSDYTPMTVFIAAVLALVVLLALFYAVNIVITIVFTVLTLFLLRGALTLLSTYFPLKYSDRIESGKFSLIINAFSSLAAGVMPYTISFVLEKTNWTVYYGILVTVAAAALAMLVVARLGEGEKDRNYPV